KCIEVEKQIGSLLDGEVSFAVREEVEHHLKECRVCGQIHEKLRAVNELLMKPVPVSDPKRLDELVMDGFYRHQNKKQEINETVGWRTALSRLSLIPKTAAALTALLFVASVGLAFQLGRITATGIPAALPQTEKVSQSALKENNVSVSLAETASDIKNEAPATKVIRIPVIREKIVNRIVYVDKSQKKERENGIPSVVSERNNLALKSSTRKNEFLTKVNLKGLQVVSDSKTRIIKKGESYEN
ncbi:MAG TPA: zf-HC2 domain-containing protein, partial [Pyrinomonadaceae bacterium]